jgi:nucleoside 2-deoxyribosyltransferase
LPNAAEIGRRKKELCAEHGFEGLFPFDNEAPKPLHGEPLDRLIYRMNLAMLRDADGGIFNLTPFRGPSADVGSAFELGVLTGLGKPAFAYSNETETLLDRLTRDGFAVFDEATGAWRDPTGMEIENFGNADNLMLDACLAEQGRPIVRRRTSEAERFTALDGFVACLGLAKRHFFPAMD